MKGGKWTQGLCPTSSRESERSCWVCSGTMKGEEVQREGSNEVRADPKRSGEEPLLLRGWTFGGKRERGGVTLEEIGEPLEMVHIHQAGIVPGTLLQLRQPAR